MKISLKLLSHLKYWFFGFGIYSYMNIAFADSPNAASLVENFSSAVPNLMRLVTAMAYVMGIFLVIKGIADFKQYGESRTMMSREHAIKGPLLSILAGTLMLYLPSTMQVSLTTFWKEPSPIAYLPLTDQTLPVLYNDCYMIIALIGTIAFIRGLLLLSHMGERGQPGTFGRCMTHLIAGTFCVNLYQFSQTISSTLGLAPLTN